MYALRLVTHLGGLGHESFLAYARGGALLERFNEVPCRTYRISPRALDFTSFWRNLAAVRRLAGLARKLRAEVIHAHVFEAYVWASLASLLTGVPLFRTVVARRRDAQWWSPPVERLLGHLTRHLVAFTRTSRDELAGFGVTTRKISIVPNGVDPLWFEPTVEAEALAVREGLGLGNHRIVGTVGRLHWHKNQQLFLKAAAIVADRFPEVRFVIDGDGPLREDLEALRDTVGLSGRVTFTGLSPDVRRLMSALDVFVLSSVTEGVPTVVLEAMALGLPVVATAVGGVGEVIVDGKTGLLVESGDEAGLADAICRVLSSRDEAERLGTAGRAWCRSTCDFRAIARKIEASYIVGSRRENAAISA